MSCIFLNSGTNPTKFHYPVCTSHRHLLVFMQLLKMYINRRTGNQNKASVLVYKETNNFQANFLSSENFIDLINNPERLIGCYYRETSETKYN